MWAIKRSTNFRCLVLVLSVFAGVSHAKTDIVIFNNGDRLTGEVKSLERGRLRFKTEATDTISIEWDDVARVSSDHNIQVETLLGARFLGHIANAGEAKMLIVESSAGPIELNHVQVVKMTPIEEKGLSQIDGDITFGYNFTKANEVEQLNIGVDLEYRTELRRMSMDFDGSLTDSSENDPNQRENLIFDFKRLLRNRWLWGANLSFTRNDELDLDLRTSLGGGGGRLLRQTDHSSFILEGGLLYTTENLAATMTDPNPETKKTIEAYGTITWDWFRYDTPELDLSTTLQVIPNLTDTGRVRGEFDIDLKWEMIEDLFWQLSYYNSYDSDPATVGAEKNDYGIVTSIGYSF